MIPRAPPLIYQTLLAKFYSLNHGDRIMNISLFSKPLVNFIDKKYLLGLLLIPLLLPLNAANGNEPIQPLPSASALNPQKLALGAQLFHDKRLSRDNSVACASCHDLSKGGTDQQSVSIGIDGAQGPINAPTVFNSGLNFRQFWDGRAVSLEEQIDGPLHAKAEMDSNWPQVIAKLAQDRSYRRMFVELYPDGIQSHTIKDAIATYERSLLTPSRFDDYLNGNSNALSQKELQGYQLFKNYGCVACHQGVNVGGNMFQVFGVMGNYFEDRGNITEVDLGRYNVTGKEHDRHKFRVPSLRNVALTPPYFHDGSAKTLEEAVEIMIKYQLGRIVPQQDRDLIIQFLHTLTGQQEGDNS